MAVTRYLLTYMVLSIMIVARCGAQPLRVLVITGGHDYNREAFGHMFDSLPGPLTWRTEELPGAFAMFESRHRHEYDVVVFYHMWQSISHEQENIMAECISQGKPLVVLHHSICAFDNWDEYRQIIGGRYFHRTDTVDGRIMPASSYEHDVNVGIRVVDGGHPVTSGISDFVLWDETYNNFYVNPGVTPLLATDNPGSSPVIGWTWEYGKARVVSIQPGHDSHAFHSSEYRKLLWQAIVWTYNGGKSVKP